MAAQSNIDVKILAEFLGKSAFKQAENATKQLTSSVKKLGSAVGLSFGVYGIKAMGQAFLDDAKAAQVLATNLKNVGLGFNTGGAEAFIKVMQDQTGILDDELRPAYSQLARVTGSVEKTQQMLALAFDTAAGTGNDFSSVVDALSQAYVGNTKGLKSLNTGLTTAELSTMTYAQIADRLAKQFNGSGQASLEGYAGQFALLNVKIADSKEALGKSFIDLLAAFSGDQGVGGASKSVEKLAGTFSKAIDGIASLVSNVKIAGPILIATGIAVAAAWAPWLTGIATAALAIGAIGNALSKNKPQEPVNKGPLWFPSSDSSISMKIQKEKAAAEKAAADRAKELAALTQKNTKAQQDALKLAKAKAVFDIQKIQIEAALKGKISEEDRIRLKLMKAIEDENVDAVTKLQEQLKVAQEKTLELQKATQTVGTTKVADPFSGWADYAKTAIELTNKVAQASLEAGLAAGNSLASALSGARYAAQGAAAAAAAAITATVTGVTGTTNGLGAKTTDPIVTKAEADAAAAKAAADAAAAEVAKLQADLVAAKALAESANIYAQRNAVVAAGEAQAKLDAALAALAAANQAAATAANNANNTVVVNVAGSVLSENDLATVVNDAINNSSWAGNAIGFGRTATVMQAV